jgi:hypothetical protein
MGINEEFAGGWRRFSGPRDSNHHGILVATNSVTCRPSSAWPEGDWVQKMQ